jgi:hypothetical protein
MNPYGAAVLVGMAHTASDAKRSYDAAAGRVSGRRMPTFAPVESTGLTGLTAHLAVWCEPGIAELDVPAGATLVFDGWTEQGLATAAYQDVIGPRVHDAGLTATPIQGMTLIGLITTDHYDLTEFDAATAYSQIMLSPDEIETDHPALYHEVTREAVSDGGPIPRGLGIHFAFATPRGHILIAETWQNLGAFQRFQEEQLGGAIERAFRRHDVKADLTFVPVEVLGADAGDETINYASGTIH